MGWWRFAATLAAAACLAAPARAASPDVVISQVYGRVFSGLFK